MRDNCNAGPVLVTCAHLAEQLRTTVASFKRLSGAEVDISDWVLTESENASRRVTKKNGIALYCWKY